ncbi:MAG TPA: TonB family protein [Thermoanaerobaculia bacterium]|jgi:protein TonB
MFDTSLIRPRAVAAPRRFTLLTASILLHTIVVVGALTLGVASTPVPPEPPRQLELYRATEPPPPPPRGERPRTQSQLPVQRPKPAPAPMTAPSAVPEQTPVLAEPGPQPTGPVGTDTVGEGPIGDPNGKPEGVGEQPSVGGNGNAPLNPGGDVTRARVISRVEPRFPPALVHAVRSATVIVRCVIDKEGQIRDPEIITSSFPLFNDAVIAALRQWKFVPGSMRGKPVDTWFELTVRFEVR